MKKTFSPQTADLLWPCNRVNVFMLCFFCLLASSANESTCYCRLCKGIPGHQCSAPLNCHCSVLELVCFLELLLMYVWPLSQTSLLQLFMN